MERPQWRGLVRRGQVASCIWALLATMAGSACPRHRHLDDKLMLTSGSGLGLRTTRTCGGADRGDTHLRPSRKLAILLHGDVKVIGNWTCQDECLPPHEEKAAEVREKENQCTETQQIGSLKLQDDIDLKCLGDNLTCDDIENNATWKNWKQTMYSNCNQDEDLLYGECEMICRFGIHPTKRCTYLFDRHNKYGMHGSEGVYGFDHCVMLKVCDKEKNTTTEDNYLYCNITDTHKLLATTTGTTTSTPATSPISGASVVTPAPIMVYAPTRDSEGGGAVVMGAVIGGCAVGSMALVSTIMYFLVCRGSSPPSGSLPTNLPTGVLHESADGGGNTVVVGRPVSGVAPPAGATAAPGNEKGEKDIS